MEQPITFQGHAIRTQTTRYGAQRQDARASTMAKTLRYFTRMNPPVYFGSRTNEDRHEFMDEVHKKFYAMGVNEEDKVKLVSYQLKDMAQVR